MSPEATILAINAAFLALAYGWIYPAILAAQAPKPLRLFLQIDVAISAAALVTVSLLYAGAGHAFSLLLVDVPWWAFTILTFMAMELPVWEWFRRRNGIDYDDF